jgi:D-alanine-D-alanine ligase
LEASKFGRVAVLMGGTSNERDISLKSGEAVLASLIRQKVNAMAIDPKYDDLDQLVDFDRAFICLHGKDGEDGKIQTFLEDKNLPYTGSGINSSLLGMDKLKSKKIWKTSKISTPDFLQVTNVNEFNKASDLCGLPFFVKPANSGSSIGISIVRNKKEFVLAFENARKVDSIVIAESLVIGKEYTLPIIKDIPFPIIEIISKTEFYDFEAKYLRNDTEFICPVNLDSSIVRTINNISINAFHAINCSGWGRVDFMIDNNEEIYIIEINTVPGLTNHSLVPMSAKQIGIEFDALIMMILETSNA